MALAKPPTPLSMDEMLKEAIETTGDDYYAENREELTKLNGKEAHEAVKQAMDERDEFMKKYQPEEYARKQKEKEERQKARKKKNPFKDEDF